MWKQLFTLHWGVNPEIPLRDDIIRESSWYSEYKRLHLFQHGPPTLTSNVHQGEAVYDLTFSRSGKFLCSSSKHLVVVWSVGDDSIDIINKLYVSCSEDSDPDFENPGDMGVGVRYTLFNETDEFFLVFGLQLQLDGEQHTGKLYQVLVYTFPDCYMTRTIEWLGVENCDANPGWLGRFTFTISANNDQGFVGRVLLCSVFDRYDSVELVNIYNDIEDIAIMNDKSGMQKFLAFCYIDDELNDDLEYSQNAHKMALYAIHSDLPMRDHICNPRRFCCIESKYWSPDPAHYTSDTYPSIDKHLGAAIRQIDDTLTPNFAVICRPTRKPDEQNNSYYSDDRLDLRIYDLKMNLLRKVPLQTMVPPKLYLFDHDYWLDENINSLLISGDLDPGLLHYYDLYFNVHVKKKTGHTLGLNYAGFSPSSPFFLCTVSDDYLVKFWDFRSYFT